MQVFSRNENKNKPAKHRALVINLHGDLIRRVNSSDSNYINGLDLEWAAHAILTKRFSVNMFSFREHYSWISHDNSINNGEKLKKIYIYRKKTFLLVCLLLSTLQVIFIFRIVFLVPTHTQSVRGFRP